MIVPEDGFVVANARIPRFLPHAMPPLRDIRAPVAAPRLWPYLLRVPR